MLNPGKIITLGQLREALLRADRALEPMDDEVGFVNCLQLSAAPGLARWLFPFLAIALPT